MRPTTFLIGTLLLTSPAWAQNETALKSADRDAQASLHAMTQARQEYLDAVKKSGQDSAEAHTAKARLDASREAWHEKLDAKRKLRQEAHGEMMRQRAERREHKHP